MIFRMAFVFLVAFLSACGPGAGDGEDEIADGYVIGHAGGDQVYIASSNSSGDGGRIVISPSVQQFFLKDNLIFVSRMPVLDELVDGVLKSRGLGECEYWLIDVRTHSVQGPWSKKQRSEVERWRSLVASLDAQKLRDRGYPCPLID